MAVSYFTWAIMALFQAFFVTASASSSDPLSTRMALSIVSRQQGIMTGTGGSSEPLQAGFVQKALSKVAAQYPDQAATVSLNGHVEKSASSVLPFILNATHDALSYPLDRLSNGNAMIGLYLASRQPAWSDGVGALRKSIDENRRTDEGGLWYYVYPHWSYLDGMYSLAPFHVLNALDFESVDGASLQAALDDVRLQLELLWTHCRNESSGLLVHGYDASGTASWVSNTTEDGQKKTGASPHVWGRSLGWFYMSLVDTLDVLASAATDHQHVAVEELRRCLLDMYQHLSTAVLRAADPSTGAWWQVMDQPGGAGNYIESSGSAMFIYGLLRGLDGGFLVGADVPGDAGPGAWEEVASNAYRHVVDTFVVEENAATLGYNGTVSVCSLNSTASYEYYVRQPISYNSVLGSAAFILASLEYEKLSTNGVSTIS